MVGRMLPSSEYDRQPSAAARQLFEPLSSTGPHSQLLLPASVELGVWVSPASLLGLQGFAGVVGPRTACLANYNTISVLCQIRAGGGHNPCRPPQPLHSPLGNTAAIQPAGQLPIPKSFVFLSAKPLTYLDRAGSFALEGQDVRPDSRIRARLPASHHPQTVRSVPAGRRLPWRSTRCRRTIPAGPLMTCRSAPRFGSAAFRSSISVTGLIPVSHSTAPATRSAHCSKLPRVVCRIRRPSLLSRCSTTPA